MAINKKQKKQVSLKSFDEIQSMLPDIEAHQIDCSCSISPKDALNKLFIELFTENFAEILTKCHEKGIIDSAQLKNVVHQAKHHFFPPTNSI